MSYFGMDALYCEECCEFYDAEEFSAMEHMYDSGVEPEDFMCDDCFCAADEAEYAGSDW